MHEVLSHWCWYQVICVHQVLSHWGCYWTQALFWEKTKIFSQRPKSSKKSMDLVHNIRCHKRGKSPKSSEHTYLHYTTLQYITLHYIIYITLHYNTLHYITLHYITFMHRTWCTKSYVTRGANSPKSSEHTYLPYITLHYTTLHSHYIALHCSTLQHITYIHGTWCTKLYVTRGA